MKRYTCKLLHVMNIAYNKTICMLYMEGTMMSYYQGCTDTGIGICTCTDTHSIVSVFVSRSPD